VLTKPSQTCPRMLHAGCSGLGLRCTTLPFLSFAGSGVFNQIIHLFLLSTFRRARHWGCPPKRQPLPPPSRRWATPPARANRPPETKDSAARWDARPADDLVASVVDHLLEVTLVFVFIFVRSRLSGSSHEGLNLLDRDGPIFVGIHRLEDFFVSGLKFLQ